MLTGCHSTPSRYYSALLFTHRVHGRSVQLEVIVRRGRTLVQDMRNVGGGRKEGLYRAATNRDTFSARDIECWPTSEHGMSVHNVR